VIDYIRRNKEWIFSGIGVAILSGVFLFFSQCFHRAERQPAPAQEPTPRRLDPSILASEAGAPVSATPSPFHEQYNPVSTPTPTPSVPQWKTIANETLERIREQHKVKLMDPLHNELQFSRLPRGVFGYVYGDFLDDLDRARVRLYKSNSAYEIHKLPDGAAILVGFVSSEIVQRIARDDKLANFQFTLYSECWADAAVPIALRMRNIKVSPPARSITIDNNNFTALDVILEPSHRR
jgi:hypothetical protein